MNRISVIKKVFKTLILICFIVMIAGFKNASACEIEFEVIEGEKEVYAVGDVIIVKITVTFTHRICPEGIKATKFKTNGLKVIGAKEWDEVSHGVFERELKIKVTGNEDGEVTINAIRTCDKTGGSGSLTLLAKPVVITKE